MSAAKAPGSGTDPAKLSYTDAAAELEEIVSFFEQRDVDVDLLVAKLERATALVEELDGRLASTRTQVEQLAPRLSNAAPLGDGELAVDPETGEVR